MHGVRDGRVGGDRIDPAAVRHLAAPAVLIPVAALKPGAPGQRLRRGGDARDELRGIGGVAQRGLRQHRRGLHEMDVRIDEAGGDERALQVDHAGALASAGAHRTGADRGDAVALHPDRVGAGVGPGAGPDPCVDICRVEIAPGGEGIVCDRRRGGAGAKREKPAAAEHHLPIADLRGGFSARHLSSRASQVAAESGP